MKPPFKLPIRREVVGRLGSDCWVLVAADHELIGEIDSATSTEIEYIVTAVNEFGRLNQFERGRDL